jgi:hypothetical protein
MSRGSKMARTDYRLPAAGGWGCPSSPVLCTPLTTCPRGGWGVPPKLCPPRTARPPGGVGVPLRLRAPADACPGRGGGGCLPSQIFCAPALTGRGTPPEVAIGRAGWGRGAHLLREPQLGNEYGAGGGVGSVRADTQGCDSDDLRGILPCRPPGGRGWGVSRSASRGTRRLASGPRLDRRCIPPAR